MYAVLGISILIGIVFCILIVYGIKMLKKTSSLYPNQKVEPFKEIPDGNRTPAEIALLYYYQKSEHQSSISRVLASTILDLSLKGYLTINTNSKLAKKDQIIIEFIDDQTNAKLKDSEKLILDLLRKIPKDSNSMQFTMKELEKYANRHDRVVFDVLRKVQKHAKTEQTNCGNYSKKTEKVHNNWATAGIAIIISRIVS